MGEVNPIIIASKGGAPKHPGWYRNVLVNPMSRSRLGRGS
ncbi:MAG: nitroreductase family deazaflavin-dependent oxidoreductase [Acidobacteria bacterium]|nr:nitroreductase family deazaflavin-dependent oxidoreductase [Acidobacteriota bacterium]